MEFFAKIVNHFRKRVHCRCLTGFSMRLCCVCDNCLFVKFLIQHHLLLFHNFSGDSKLDSNFWNDPVLGSVGRYFMEIGAYLSQKRASTGVWEGRFCWIWVKLLSLKYKNGGLRPKYSIAWFCLSISRNIFS